MSSRSSDEDQRLKSWSACKLNILFDETNKLRAPPKEHNSLYISKASQFCKPQKDFLGEIGCVLLKKLKLIGL